MVCHSKIMKWLKTPINLQKSAYSLLLIKRSNTLLPLLVFGERI